MRETFLHYYTPTKEEFASLWRTAVFSFDASVLLDLYRYTKASREELLRLFKEYQDRIWLTHQAGLEFSRNRVAVIGEAKKKAADLRKQIDNLKTVSNDRYQQHPFVSSEVCGRIAKACEKFSKELQAAENAYPNYLNEDPILSELLELFTGKIGAPFTDEEIKLKSSAIDTRYAAEIPPGFADAKNKDAPRSYGDCFLWFQIIEFSKKANKPIILVTRDLKDDWWLREGGKTLLPHPELRREFKAETGQDFYLYQASMFIEEAKAYRQNSVSTTLLEEARAMSEASRLRQEQVRETSTAIAAEGINRASLSQGIEASLDQRSSQTQLITFLIEKLLRSEGTSTQESEDADQNA
jgi:hypothetical protein